MYKRKEGGQKHPHQDSISDFLKVPNDFRKDQIKVNNAFGFTPFDPKHSEQSAQLAAEFMTIANDNPNEPIKKVLEFAKETSKTTDPQLVRHALMTFITHHPSARNGNLRIPSLVKRSPESSIPKKKVSFTPGPFIDRTVKESDDGDVELLLNWFREDPNYNEHHEHWHIVYQGQGVPDPKNPKGNRIQMDRHGELFLYMHRQLLARYDVERLGLNLPLVQPLDNYRDPIQQEYKPDEQLVDSADMGNKNSTAFSSRGNNLVLGDVDFGDGKILISNMEKLRKQIEDVIDKGQFYDGTEVTTNLLGAVLESSNVGRKSFSDYYGSLHSQGHVAIAYINNPSKASDADVNPGVMSDTRVAARDPIFYRWHRHVDELANKWEEKLGPNDFSKSPPVKIRDGDIILVFKDKLPINQGGTQDSDAADFAEKTFGGKSFDTDVSSNEFVTHALETKMKNRKITLTEDSGATEEIEYLYPREFYYFFRVENTSSSSLNATFRVFLVPEELAESRRHWIELDKFKQSLPPNSKTVVSRDCDMSSVVRQPPQKTEDELNDIAIPPDDQGEQRQDIKYCDCGWPYHLLLPRGRKGGMKFKLLVFITDWSEDEVPRISRCGSISYCGAASPTEKYPDSKPMGYPFDRPFKNNSYKETFNGLNNASIRDVTINWVNNFPEIAASA